MLAYSPIAAFAAAPPPVEVTTCGQGIPRKTVGYLTADLDCTGYDGAPGAILLGRKATLELRGHRVTGGRLTVLCGEIAISDVTIENSGQEGIHTRKKARVENVTVTGSSGDGMRLGGRAIVQGSTVTANGENGVSSKRKLQVFGSTIVGNGMGPSCTNPWGCADIRSVVRPLVVETTCDTSGAPPNGDWDVCALD